MHTAEWSQAAMGAGSSDLLWEWFHENSKTGRYDSFASNEAIVAEMQARGESLDYAGQPPVELPPPAPLSVSLGDAMAARQTAREMTGATLTLPQLATLLHSAYGVTRSNEGTAYVRPFRTIPSGGGLYPLEIYFQATRIDGLSPGLYHYNAAEHLLRRLRDGDLSGEVAAMLVQPEIAERASVVFFITALFERTVFKYRDRGYRFVFIEAGHLAQNLNLAATALGLGTTNVGGFFDRDADRFLRLDGVSHSTIYMNAVGGPG